MNSLFFLAALSLSTSAMAQTDQGAGSVAAKEALGSMLAHPAKLQHGGPRTVRALHPLLAAPGLRTALPMPVRSTGKAPADQHIAVGEDRGGAPLNNNCSGAIALTVGATCVGTAGTVDQATQSIAAIDCATFIGNANDDVWYSFVANATDVTIFLECNEFFDGVIDLRSGACNGTNIDCMDNFIAGGSETLYATGLTIGTTYRFRVYDYEAGYPTDPTFSVCVYGTPPAPANDLCDDAVITAVSVPGSETITGDNTGALDTEGFGLASAWEAFTIPACADVTINYCGTDPVFGNVFISLATDCSFGTIIDATSFADCGDGNQSLVFLDLAAGTYYVPVLMEAGVAEGPYTIEISTVACGGGSTPANDLCDDAVITPVSVPGSATVTGDNTGALDTEGFGLGSVWEAFTIAACADVTINYCGTDPVFGNVFISLTTDCSFGTVIDATSFADCGDGNQALVYEDLAAGTYYIPVLMEVGVAEGPYTIDISTVACGGGNTPPNDDCGGVTASPLSTPGSATFNGDNTGATETGDFVPGSGLEGFGPCVWHAFTTTACANITVSYCGTDPAYQNVAAFLAPGCPATDADYVLFSDGNFTDCADGNATLFFTAVPAGTWYLPVLWDAAAPAEGPYTIEVTTEACLPAPPNDNCAGAIALDVNLTCEPTTGEVNGATQSIVAVACNGFTGIANDDVWYSFIATGPNETITVQGSDSLDAVIELFAGNCGGLSSLGCGDATFQGEAEEIVMTNLVEGSTYFVRVYDYYGGYPATTTFDICITGDFGTGVQNQDADLFTVSPNPGDGDLRLTWAGGSGMVRVALFDVSGRLVHEQRASLQAGASMDLDLAGKLAAGTYTLQLTTAAGRAEERVIVR